jgi:hypothetical protein
MISILLYTYILIRICICIYVNFYIGHHTNCSVESVARWRETGLTLSWICGEETGQNADHPRTHPFPGNTETLEHLSRHYNFRGSRCFRNMSYCTPLQSLNLGSPMTMESFCFHENDQNCSDRKYRFNSCPPEYCDRDSLWDVKTVLFIFWVTCLCGKIEFCQSISQNLVQTNFSLTPNLGSWVVTRLSQVSYF